MLIRKTCSVLSQPAKKTLKCHLIPRWKRARPVSQLLSKVHLEAGGEGSGEQPHVRQDGRRPRGGALPNRFLMVNVDGQMLPASKELWYLRLIDPCITQLKAQGPFRTCSKSEEGTTRNVSRLFCVPGIQVQNLVLNIDYRPRGGARAQPLFGVSSEFDQGPTRVWTKFD